MNPKSTLLEFCMQARCAPPVIETFAVAPRWGARCTVNVHGQAFDSDVHWAEDKTSAEQLAAKALLAALARSEEEAEHGEWVSAEEATQLQAANPKGRLLERCASLRLVPHFDVRVLVDVSRGVVHEACVRVEQKSGEDIWSDLRRAPTAKLAEHAAAASLLGRLPHVRKEAGPRVSDPRMLLNDWRQAQRLVHFSFEVEGTDGPPHAPRFRMAARALLPSGEVITAGPLSAASKKDGERQLAEMLVERVRSLGAAGDRKSAPASR